jgi:hypothetical protein
MKLKTVAVSNMPYDIRGHEAEGSLRRDLDLAPFVRLPCATQSSDAHEVTQTEDGSPKEENETELEQLARAR